MSEHDSSSAASPAPAALLEILETARRLACPTALPALLADIGRAGRSLLGADRGNVLLYDADARALYAVGGEGEADAEAVRFSVDTGITGEAARLRKTIHAADCQSDPRFDTSIDRKTGYRTRCLVASPMIGLDGELVGVLTMLNPSKGAFTSADIALAEVLAGQAASAIQRVRLLEDRATRAKLERDLDLARRIQQNLLPTDPPRVAGYDIAGAARPAEQTGGDIFDIARWRGFVEPMHGGGGLAEGADGDRTLLFLADATGHGIGPALAVTQVRSMLRMAMHMSSDLDSVVSHLNDQLCVDLPGGQFATAFLGVLDSSRHTIRYHAAGQGPLLHWRSGASGSDADGGACWLAASAPPLGVVEGMAFGAAERIEMARGDVLVLLTDGFYEHPNGRSPMFGKAGVEAVVREAAGGSAASIVEALYAAVKRHDPASPGDDLTAVVVKRV